MNAERIKKTQIFQKPCAISFSTYKRGGAEMLQRNWKPKVKVLKN